MDQYRHSALYSYKRLPQTQSGFGAVVPDGMKEPWWTQHTLSQVPLIGLTTVEQRTTNRETLSFADLHGPLMCFAEPLQSFAGRQSWQGTPNSAPPSPEQYQETGSISNRETKERERTDDFVLSDKQLQTCVLPRSIDSSLYLCIFTPHCFSKAGHFHFAQAL